jgi:uncharacterized membrane protein HdeD (DUF308 family)
VESQHPLAAAARALTHALEAEVRRGFLSLASTFMTLLACTIVLITAYMAAVVIGIILLVRGLIKVIEMLIGPSWGAEMAVGAVLLLVPLLIAWRSLRRSRRTGPGTDAV